VYTDGMEDLFDLAVHLHNGDFVWHLPPCQTLSLLAHPDQMSVFSSMFWINSIHRCCACSPACRWCVSSTRRTPSRRPRCYERCVRTASSLAVAVPLLEIAFVQSLLQTGCSCDCARSVNGRLYQVIALEHIWLVGAGQLPAGAGCVRVLRASSQGGAGRAPGRVQGMGVGQTPGLLVLLPQGVCSVSQMPGQ
jgi:hypothetical protein